MNDSSMNGMAMNDMNMTGNDTTTTTDTNTSTDTNTTNSTM